MVSRAPMAVREALVRELFTALVGDVVAEVVLEQHRGVCTGTLCVNCRSVELFSRSGLDVFGGALADSPVEVRCVCVKDVTALTEGGCRGRSSLLAQAVATASRARASLPIWRSVLARAVDKRLARASTRPTATRRQSPRTQRHRVRARGP